MGDWGGCILLGLYIIGRGRGKENCACLFV